MVQVLKRAELEEWEKAFDMANFCSKKQNLLCFVICLHCSTLDR